MRAIEFLGRCLLILPALLVLNGNEEAIWINLIGLSYIIVLIFILKLWKRK
jgi:hypothetical protein